jgi:hypothetical protein
MARIKRPRDTNQLAKFIVDISIGEAEKPADPNEPVHGRAGGLKGGEARAKKLSASDRKKIAMAAANARWKRR